MPELPEVETTGRGVAAKLLNQKLLRVEQRRKDLRAPMPKGMADTLESQKLEAVERRAKYLLLRFSGEQTLLIHLGMSGRLVITAKDDGTRDKHDHLVLHFAKGMLRFNDARRFGRVDMFSTGSETMHPLLRHLGPEPLGKGFTPQVLAAALKGKKTAVKLALLDQTIVAGIGNIYACEALYYSGIAPTRAAGSLKLAELSKLVPAIKKVLNAAIKAGGSSLRDYVQSDGNLGYFQNEFAVYDREEQPCPGCTCATGVLRFTQGGRSTFWCKTKQR
jgi:formamidopyrimidine-DNA glycosylase